MQLRSLAQLNFRNLQFTRIAFSTGVTAVVGRNAAGKSNLLDAAYLALTGDLPGGRIVEMLRFGQTEGYVAAELEHDEGGSKIEVGLAAGRKILTLDGQSVRGFEIARVSAAVLITPKDADLIHGSPTRRRSYLDGLLGKVSPRYGALLREYNRVVEQRNALLKASNPDASLAVWSERFIELGDEINQLRLRAVLRVAELGESVYHDVANDRSSFRVALIQSHGDEALGDALHRSAAEEQARGATVIGPHRDDLSLDLDERSLQAYGSRGEARTAALALRVAEYRLLEDKHHEAPVLLLDDFTAELDPGRRDYLLTLAGATPQTIVSGTEAPSRSDALYRIDQGEVDGR